MDYKEIQEMEKILGEHAVVLKRMDKALSEFEEHQKQYAKLSDYYGSAEYMQDLERYEAGEIPEEGVAAVFSEDAVFDLIGENFEMALRMIEFAVKVIREH